LWAGVRELKCGLFQFRHWRIALRATLELSIAKRGLSNIAWTVPELNVLVELFESFLLQSELGGFFHYGFSFGN
jgi:hypothetical protein